MTMVENEQPKRISAADRQRVDREADTTPALIAIGLVVFIGSLFYFWVVLYRPANANFWSAMGGVIGPFAALINMLAILAVLSSIKVQHGAVAEQREALLVQREELRLQRKELRLQRKEFRESREVMKEQREQFERTAKAQEALAASQKRLADEQAEANRLAWFAEIAQRRAALATLYGIVSELDLARARNRQTPFEGSIIQGTAENRDRVTELIEEEKYRVEFLEKQLLIHRTSPGGLDESRQKQSPREG